MLLAVLNESTLVELADVQKAVNACMTQMRLHVAPIWERLPASVVYYADKKLVPPGADLVIILDHSDQAGASATIGRRLMASRMGDASRDPF
jgi:hypothetical protein